MRASAERLPLRTDDSRTGTGLLRRHQRVAELVHEIDRGEVVWSGLQFGDDDMAVVVDANGGFVLRHGAMVSHQGKTARDR